jgi:acetoin utilization deacetylase AcuC-like enzyme
VATLLFDHPAGFGHDTGPGHPESPARLVAIATALADPRFRDLGRRRAPRCDPAAILRVHPAAYLAALEAAIPDEGFTAIDDDTRLSRGSWEAMLHAAGGAVAAVDAVMQGEAANAFAVTRPPGHHASRTMPMGFCFLNNVAIAARHAQAAYGAERVAIVDFDVHHGNGTQAIFWADSSVLYCSTHEMPLFPGSGAVTETGTYNTIVNAPLAPASDGALFREACESIILPRLADFAPDAIFISAGFDAHWRDPLASLNLTEMDFAWITAEIMDIAAQHAGGRVVSVLEGGYDLEALGVSVAAHVATLSGLA